MRTGIPFAAASALALLLAGCVGPGADAQMYRVSGAFTEETTQENLDDLGQRLEPYDAELHVMESFPMQYQVRGLTEAECAEVREILEARPYVATVGECEPIEHVENPDEPVSSG